MRRKHGEEGEQHVLWKHGLAEVREGKLCRTRGKAESSTAICCHSGQLWFKTCLHADVHGIRHQWSLRRTRSTTPSTTLSCKVCSRARTPRGPYLPQSSSCGCLAWKWLHDLKKALQLCVLNNVSLALFLWTQCHNSKLWGFCYFWIGALCLPQYPRTTWQRLSTPLFLARCHAGQALVRVAITDFKRISPDHIAADMQLFRPFWRSQQAKLADMCRQHRS